MEKGYARYFWRGRAFWWHCLDNFEMIPVDWGRGSRTLEEK